MESIVNVCSMLHFQLPTVPLCFITCCYFSPNSCVALHIELKIVSLLPSCQPFGFFFCYAINGSRLHCPVFGTAVCGKQIKRICPPQNCNIFFNKDKLSFPTLFNVWILMTPLVICDLLDKHYKNLLINHSDHRPVPWNRFQLLHRQVWDKQTLFFQAKEGGLFF